LEPADDGASIAPRNAWTAKVATKAVRLSEYGRGTRKPLKAGCCGRHYSRRSAPSIPRR
jgi:hypothetical protein